jgi:hypothetical protein
MEAPERTRPRLAVPILTAGGGYISSADCTRIGWDPFVWIRVKQARCYARR